MAHQITPKACEVLRKLVNGTNKVSIIVQAVSFQAVSDRYFVHVSDGYETMKCALASQYRSFIADGTFFPGCLLHVTGVVGGGG
jgi:hypothetical protein